MFLARRLQRYTYKESYNTIIYYPNTSDVRDPLSRTPITAVYMFLTRQISDIHFQGPYNGSIHVPNTPDIRDPFQGPL
jgi:hypothetical protein